MHRSDIGEGDAMTVLPGSARRALLAAAAAAVALVGAGCGSLNSTSTAVHDAGKAQKVPGASRSIPLLTWDLTGGEPTTLDSAQTYSGSDLMVDANMCESLLTLTSSGSFHAGLATSVDRPNDVTYIIHLRPGVTFFDGHPVTPQDVVFSIDRIRNPKLGSYWGFFASSIKTVVAAGSSTVKIVLAKPDSIFYSMLSTPMAQVVEKQYVEREGSKYGTATGGVMCTGPYKLASWNTGNSITLVRNEKWWDRQQQPQRAARVKFSFVTDDATLTSALLAGDIDGSFDVPFSTLPRLQQSASGALYLGPSTAQDVLVPTQLNGGSPLSKLKLRQALAESIDYSGLLKTIYHGTGEPLRAITPPGTWGTSRSIYQAAYDKLPVPARDQKAAKALIAASGIAHPQITIACPSDIPDYVTLCQIIQSNADQVGFDVHLKLLSGASFSQMYSSKSARNKVDAFFTDYYADIPDPLELYAQVGVPGGAANFGGYRMSTVARQLENAQASSSATHRAQLTVQAQAKITHDLVWLPIAYPLWTLYLNDRFGGASVAFPSVMYSPWLPSIGGR
jgi:peptide/nickel transport system substrate-binding protein